MLNGKGEPAVAGHERDRVTVDLRGLGQRLRAQAAARHMATGAFVRRGVALQLDQAANESHGAVSSPVGPVAPVGSVVKLTLRVSAEHAVLLVTRARRADTSQGTYVADLLDGSPPAPVPPDRAAAIAALVKSTDQLAALNADIRELSRCFRQIDMTQAMRYRQRLDDLFGEVRDHLKMSADLLREVIPVRRPGGCAAVARRSARRR